MRRLVADSGIMIQKQEEKEEKRKCEVVGSFSSPFFRGTSTPI